MENINGSATNSKRLLGAGFMAILAAGVGFSIRGGILGDWGTQFGFTQTELGAITGGGLTGFGIIILLGALIADWIGYGRLMIFAFITHFLSAVLTLAATPIYNSMHGSDPEAAAGNARTTTRDSQDTPTAPVTFRESRSRSAPPSRPARPPPHGNSGGWATTGAR